MTFREQWVLAEMFCKQLNDGEAVREWTELIHMSASWCMFLHCILDCLVGFSHLACCILGDH